MAGSVVSGVLEQLDEEEGVLEALRPEAQVLVVAADLLGVEVDVEQLAGVDRLGDAVVDAEPGHRLVGDLRVEPDHLGLVERRDERQGMTDRRQERVARGSLGFGSSAKRVA